MPEQDPQRVDWLQRSAGPGQVVSAFAVFGCGWRAMSTEDWRGILFWSVLAVGAAMVGMAFKRIALSGQR